MSSAVLTLRASAKLNLFLNITGRRADGYHLLDSLFAFCDLHDTITLRDVDDLIFDAPIGPFAGLVERDGANLVMRAAELLRREAGVTAGARLGLDKHVPVAAGLGGGSSDAAATLLGLNRLWGLGWSMERLEVLAAQLGADVAACLRQVPVLARGIGDELTAVAALPPCGVLLVNPMVATPTPAVFKAFKARYPVIEPRAISGLPAAFADLDALVAAIAPRGNDLTTAAMQVAPVITDVLAAIRAQPGVVHAGLSGSGATCFALCAAPEVAATAGEGVRWCQPGWWSWAGGWAVPA